MSKTYEQVLEIINDIQQHDRVGTIDVHRGPSRKFGDTNWDVWADEVIYRNEIQSEDLLSALDNLSAFFAEPVVSLEIVRKKGAVKFIKVRRAIE